jgi:hypothetical protein
VRASTRVLKLEKSLKERMRKSRLTPMMTMIRTVRINGLISFPLLVRPPYTITLGENVGE